MKNRWLLALYLLFMMSFGVWSFSQTDRNLLLINFPPFISFQNWIWSIEATTVTVIYGVVILGLFTLYTFLIKKIAASGYVFTDENVNLFTGFFIIGFVVLIFSYNALSHDIFNYMFNAKMVLYYGANPHVQTALDYPRDIWLRFMHNVHTPAPYFYGWTGLSLIPYVIGTGKFFTTWIAFKTWSGVGLLLLILGQLKLLQYTKVAKTWQLWLFALNPLVLIETLSTGHNDAWMMGVAVWSFALLFRRKKLTAGVVVFSGVLLAVSISIKYVTGVLIPIWLLLVLQKTVQSKLFNHSLFSFVKKYTFEICAVLLFIPLFTARSQWFHPWYLIWSLSFLPVIQIGWMKRLLIFLSCSSLLRYIPWLWNGGFDFTSQILWQERLITWVVPVVLLIGWWGWHRWQQQTTISS